MKMTHSNIASKIKKSSSFNDLIIANKDYTKYLKEKSTCKSAENLPEAVSECFQDSSLIGRIHNSILLLVGRGSKYKLKTTQSCSFLSMLGQRKKKEAKKNLLELPVPKESPLPTKKDLKTNNYATSTLPSRPKVLSESSHSKRSLARQKTISSNEQTKTSSDSEDGSSKFSYISQTVNSTHEEEILLRQYMSLQQMAIARRHCNQLKKIRDSLVERAKPKSKDSLPSSEQEELRNFLMDVGFVQYYSLLNRHGYDFPTATHMDVLDLAAVGISEPLHRMALKYELDQVRLPIRALDRIPETVSEWLIGIGLPEYVEHFQQNEFFCPLAAVGLTKRDLQLMGIYMLGHRKRIVLALMAVNLTLSKNKDYSQQKVS